MVKNRVRPTALLPIWNIAGYALGMEAECKDLIFIICDDIFMLCHLCQCILFRHVMSRYDVSCHNVSFDAMLCHAMLCNNISCCV